MRNLKRDYLWKNESKVERINYGRWFYKIYKQKGFENCYNGWYLSEILH